MPVYNEAECIKEVLISWASALSQLEIRFRIIVLDDGSTDATRHILKSLAREPWIEIIEKENTGHGPTILTGYHHAAAIASWVFQCDSDGEMNPADFLPLWHKRGEFDGLLGIRQRLTRNLMRRKITALSCAIVQLLFGHAVQDVNVPFRLIRANVLSAIIRTMPRNSFAPNVMIAGALCRWKLRVYNHPLRNRNRKTGMALARQLPVFLGAARTLWQIILFSSNLSTRSPL